MMKRAALLPLFALPLYATAVRADEVASTEQANTVVVVTPSAPVVVTGASQTAQPVVQAPGMENPPAPVVAPPAPPAPQNEDWSNVSHINGQIVKVGERGDYLIKYKKTNLSANPFGPFFGYYEAAASFGITQNLAISGEIAGYSKGDSYSQHTMFQVAASMPIYFRRTFSGLFLEPGLIYRSSSSSDGYGAAASCADCSTYSNSKSWFGPELLFGWHWNFDSGLNISWAFGLAKHATDSNSDPSSYNSSEPDVNGYFRVGYNF